MSGVGERRQMRVLVGCEFSGIVRDAFLRRGHDAWSCDLLETESDPHRHYVGDVRDIIDDSWDMLIAFPPCTHLCVSGARHFSKKRQLQIEALDFVRQCFNAPIPRIAIENPVGIISTEIREPDQIIQPWMFGQSFQKTTCLWLQNLPKLEPTEIVDPGEFTVFASGKKHPKWYADARSHANTATERSRTFTGIAEAMADQWGSEYRKGVQSFLFR